MTTAEYIARWDAITNLRVRLKSGPPPEIYHLITTGHVTAAEYKQYGFRPMRCAVCEEHDLELIWNHEPIEWPSKKAITWSVVWGEDVTPLCPCCSHAGCVHKQAQLAQSQRKAAAGGP